MVLNTLLHRLSTLITLISTTKKPFLKSPRRDPSPGQIPKGPDSREGLRGAPLWNQATLNSFIYLGIICVLLIKSLIITKDMSLK